MTKITNRPKLSDIKPQTDVAALRRDKYLSVEDGFSIADVATLVGMSPTFIRRVCGRRSVLRVDDVLQLLDQDAFRETIVPRSMVIDRLISQKASAAPTAEGVPKGGYVLRKGHAIDLIAALPADSVQCVVTSTPYWAMRIYKEPHFALWADGEYCPYGHEQTPEGFVRHTIEILAALRPVLREGGSIW